SRPTRSKEEAHDYRYFPDPDLLPLVIPNEMTGKILADLPELPLIKFKRYQAEFTLSPHDAHMLSEDRGLSAYFEDALQRYNNPKGIANWIINDLLRSAKLSDLEEGIGAFSTRIPSAHIADLVKLVDEKVISSSIAKRVFALMEKSPEKHPQNIVKENNLEI